MLASHVIRYIKSRRIATRISYDLPVICFQKIYKQLNNVSHISSASIHEQTGNSLISEGVFKCTKAVFELTTSFQLQWVSRTVMVQDNNVDEAMKVLNGIMAREGMLKR